jgi:uncharacterized coiled-coil protein SlyX
MDKRLEELESRLSKAEEKIGHLIQFLIKLVNSSEVMLDTFQTFVEELDIE